MNENSLVHYFFNRQILLIQNSRKALRDGEKKKKKDTIYRCNIVQMPNREELWKTIKPRKHPRTIPKWLKLWLWNLVRTTEIQFHSYASSIPTSTTKKQPKLRRKQPIPQPKPPENSHNCCWTVKTAAQQRCPRKTSTAGAWNKQKFYERFDTLYLILFYKRFRA